ncbi:hypothetical protein [Clostridium sp.]|uniref:hypothetical protein n=1 Tax=Clostridium sp. TaxID=1506 RepID=UPI0026114529|nr:hypothetical protein [uncultured Clostridium sp.]
MNEELDANMENLIREVSEIKNRLNVVETDITNVKIESATTKEQYKNMFTILTDIKDSIKTIASKLDILEKKPARNWEQLMKIGITVVGTAVFTLLIGGLV